MRTPQEMCNKDCKEIVELLKFYEGRYRRNNDDPNVFKSLRADVFEPLTTGYTKNHFSITPDNHGNYTPVQRDELVGLLRRFRGEIDLRINYKSADRNTRTIHEDAMRALNALNRTHGDYKLGEIEMTPTASVILQNFFRDKVERQGPSNTNTNRL